MPWPAGGMRRLPPHTELRPKDIFCSRFSLDPHWRDACATRETFQTGSNPEWPEGAPGSTAPGPFPGSITQPGFTC